VKKNTKMAGRIIGSRTEIQMSDVRKKSSDTIAL
jgi:hypothetical protein